MRSQLVANLVVVLGFGAVFAIGWLAYQLGLAWELGIGAGAFIVTLLAIAAARRTPLRNRWVVPLMVAPLFSTMLSAGLLDIAGLWWASAGVMLTYIAGTVLFPPWGTHIRRMQDAVSTWEPEEIEPAESGEPADTAEPQVWRSAAHQREWDAVERHQGIVVYPDKRKLLGIGILALAFCAGLLFWIVALTRNGVPHDPGYIVGFILSILLVPIIFGFGVLVTFYRLISRTPALVVDDQGIRDNISVYLGGVGMLRWEEVAALFPFSERAGFPNYRYLAIAPRDVEAVLFRQGFLTRAFMKRIAERYPAPIIIPQRVLPMKVDDLLAQIWDRYGREIQRHHVTIVDES
jgi:hypothetical protein